MTFNKKDCVKLHHMYTEDKTNIAIQDEQLAYNNHIHTCKKWVKQTSAILYLNLVQRQILKVQNRPIQCTYICTKVLYIVIQFITNKQRHFVLKYNNYFSHR